LLVWSRYGSDPVVFVLASAVYFGVYGEIFSLFPATQGDTFGSKFAATNAGMLYTAKGTAALVVPLASALAVSQGWVTVFTLAITFNVVAALLAIVVLKPMRARHFASSRGTVTPPSAGAAAVAENRR
jgi:MFS transporter, OFA family, oxalate/formate antiporter